jgi:hypothetical protein
MSKGASKGKKGRYTPPKPKPAKARLERPAGAKPLRPDTGNVPVGGAGILIANSEQSFGPGPRFTGVTVENCTNGIVMTSGAAHFQELTIKDCPTGVAQTGGELNIENGRITKTRGLATEPIVEPPLQSDPDPQTGSGERLS